MFSVIYDFFCAPFESDFMRNAFACVVLVGTNSALLGCYVLHRRSVFITSALSHTILPGVVVAMLLGISLYWGALAAAILTALGVGLLSTQKKINEDAAIGVVLAFMFAVGILLMTQAQSFRDFTGLLFGSILGVSEIDLAFAAGTTLAVAIFFLLFHKNLKLSTFDPEYAALIGARPRMMQVLFLAFVALSAVSSVRIIGALLTTALLVIPAATANLLTRSVPATMKTAVFLAIFTGALGLYASYHLDGIPAGAAIVIAESLIFFICWVFKKLFG